MTIETWLAFIAASLILVATPGPSIFLGVVHSINFGVKRVIFTALGDISANALQMVLVSIGLGVVVMTSEYAFDVIKWCGVVTLVYIGVKIFFTKASAIAELDLQSQSTSNVKLYISGFMVAAGNPKAIVFFTAFLPQFIDSTQPIFQQLLILCPTMAILDFTLVMLYACMAKTLVNANTSSIDIINKISGGLLIGVAGFLAATNKPI